MVTVPCNRSADDHLGAGIDIAEHIADNGGTNAQQEVSVQTPFDHLVGGAADHHIGSWFDRWVPQWITPNCISSARLALVPWIIAMLVMDAYGIATAIFVTTMALDVIDGPLARIRGQVSDLGKLLDPLADKACILVTFWTWYAITRGNHLAVSVVAVLGVLLTIVELWLLVPRLRSFHVDGIARAANNHGKAKVWYEGFMVGILLLEPHVELSALLAIACGAVALHLAVWSALTARTAPTPER